MKSGGKYSIEVHPVPGIVALIFRSLALTLVKLWSRTTDTAISNTTFIIKFMFILRLFTNYLEQCGLAG